MIKVALAGAGMVADHHCPAWRKLERVEIVSIFSRDLAKAQRKADRYSIPAAYDDYLRMLDNETPDVVDIATAPEAHYDQVLEAASRGIDVLCQKPMTPDLASSLELVDNVGEKVRFMVHENWRFRPQYRQISRWLQEGRLGSVHEFKMAVRSSGLITRTDTGGLFALERQPFFAALDRFIIMELLIHHLDTMRFLLGPLRVIGCVTAKICSEVSGEDVAEIALRTDSGGFGTVTGNFSAAGFPPLPQDDLELIGDKGSVIFRDHILSLSGPQPEKLIYDRKQAYQASYNNAIGHFCKALRGGTPFETDRLDNLATMRLVEDAYRQALAG